MDEDWEVLRSFLPANWQELAQESGTRKLTKPDPNALGEILYSLMTDEARPQRALYTPPR